MSKIFVQIASYRDPELKPTILDCIKKAKFPENLTFGVCWQNGPEEQHLVNFLESVPHLKYINVPHLESKGLCWARSIIQGMWDGEEYTLQIDSHHRFADNWDTELIKMMELTGSKKPILTSYAGMYRPETNEKINNDPYKMVADKFTDSGTILFRPHSIPGWQDLKTPEPARFVSGHFFFTLGQHCEEYKYDPNLYFAGDEISLSIRSYTLGYDLYHPHKLLVWHEYTREGRSKHWTDFDQKCKEEKKIDKTWWEMDVLSKKRLRHLLREENNEIDLGIYGLGTVRTHRDYEMYAGINFEKRLLHPKTKDGVPPPINDKSDWEILKLKKHTIVARPPYVTDISNIYIGVEDETGKVLHRIDLKSFQKEVRLEFESYTEPFKWVFWPINKTGEWYNRQDFIL